MVCMSHDQTDSRIYQGILIRNLGRIENKINLLTTVTEGEMRHGLHKRRLEYVRQQQGQKEPTKIKRLRSRTHWYRKFNRTNRKSHGQRNTHSCEKASCKYSMEEFKYNQDGFAEHMPYYEFLHMASQKKVRMDRLKEGVARERLKNVGKFLWDCTGMKTGSWIMKIP